MKIICLALAAVTLGTVPGIVSAGTGGTTCATAQQLFSNSTYSGDTSAPGYGNPVGAMGPLPSPANDAIYYFVSDGQATTGIAVTAAGYNFGIFLTTDCGGSTSPPIQAATGPTVPATLQLNNNGGALTAGATYYVILSANPSDASAPSGTFSFSTPFTPVTLQSFTID